MPVLLFSFGVDIATSVSFEDLSAEAGRGIELRITLPSNSKTNIFILYVVLWENSNSVTCRFKPNILFDSTDSTATTTLLLSLTPSATPEFIFNAAAVA